MARTTGKNGNSGLNSSLSELEQIKGMTIAIASSEYPKRLKCAGCILWKERGGGLSSLVVILAVSGRRESSIVLTWEEQPKIESL